MGIIEVIHVVSKGVGFSERKGVLSVTSTSKVDLGNRPKKKPRRTLVVITFDKVDLNRTSQPHDDVLVITCMIGGFPVKRVMVDQGSEAKIIYPDLYKGLGLKLEDLSRYDTPLVGFDGRW